MTLVWLVGTTISEECIVSIFRMSVVKYPSISHSTTIYVSPVISQLMLYKQVTQDSKLSTKLNFIFF